MEVCLGALGRFGAWAPWAEGGGDVSAQLPSCAPAAKPWQVFGACDGDVPLLGTRCLFVPAIHN